ncbi:MAG: hypothetical protein ACPGVB_00890 [Chitinophagales bacterium]
MNHLYHQVPSNLEGENLHPLNELKTVKPHIYEKAVQKYKGRQVLLSRKVPILDCLWNDVIHFSPIHPAKVFATLDEISGKKFLNAPRSFFEVNPTEMNFNAENTVIYLHPVRKKGVFDAFPEDFIPFNEKLLVDYQELRLATIEYFRNAIKNKQVVFPYVFVPHILHKGSLEIEKLKLIEVD